MNKLKLTFGFIVLIYGIGFTQNATWTYYNESNSDIPGNWIWGINIDSVQNVWVSTVNDGLGKYNGTNWNTFNTSNSDIPDNTCLYTAFESNGNVWVGTLSGASCFDGSNWSDPIGCDVWDIEFDQDSNIWVATLGYGLAFYDYETWSYFDNDEIGTNSVFAVEIDNEGILWIGTDIGLLKYNGTSWVKYDVNNSDLPINTVISLEIDMFNDVWIGLGGSNNTGGLLKFNRTDWMVYTVANSDLPSNVINDILADDEYRIWVATGGSEAGGLAMLDQNENWVIYNNSNSGLPGIENHTSALAIDSAGCIWVGTNEGIGVLCTDQVQVISQLKSEAPANIYPNPAKDEVYINVDNIKSIELFNESGVSVDKMNQTKKIEIGAYPAGIYIIQISTNTDIITEKILKY